MIKYQSDQLKKMSSFEDLMDCVLGHSNHDELNWAVNELDDDSSYPKDDNHQNWKVILEFCRKDDACQEPEIIGIWRRWERIL